MTKRQRQEQDQHIALGLVNSNLREYKAAADSEERSFYLAEIRKALVYYASACGDDENATIVEAHELIAAVDRERAEAQAAAETAARRPRVTITAEDNDDFESHGMQPIEHRLIALGAEKWDARGEKPARYYIPLAVALGLLGLELEMSSNHYNVSYATRDGVKISNTKGTKILAILRSTKIWYDTTDGKWHGQGMVTGWEDVWDEVVAEIKRRLS